jgi:hypothetical protein
MIKKVFFLSAMVGGMMSFSPLAHATYLLPTQSCSACVLTDPTLGGVGGSVIADTGLQTVTSTGFGLNWTANFEAEVYREASGTLDFLFQFSNVKPKKGKNGNIEILTTGGFTGFQTDVGWLATSHLTDFSNGGVAPGNINRSDADTIAFNFAGLTPGQTTFELVVRTNAVQYQAWGAHIQDNNDAGVNDYAPFATPEPASIILFGSVLTLSAWFVRRRTATKL